MRSMRHILVGTAGAIALMVLVSDAAVETGKPAEPWSAPKLREAMDALKPLHKTLGQPKQGEWLSRFKEPGQTFDEYLRSSPVVPTDKRRTIYVQPLGDFTEKQRRVITLAADYIGVYFNLPVRMSEDLPLSVVPPEARRVHPTSGERQVLTTYVLDKVLKPRLPADAFAYIAFASSDLWPGEGWNFVFGQASLRDRVGVWSISRYGDPAQGDAEFRLCLWRTMTVGTHELGHMFSIPHCIAYQCNMGGSNSLSESDRQPSEACPECMAKLCWATHTDPVERFKKLAAWCDAQGFKVEVDRYREFLKALAAREAGVARVGEARVLSEKEIAENVRVVTGGDTLPDARFEAVLLLATSPFTPESAGALAEVACNAKDAVTTREYAAMGLGNFTGKMPDEMKAAIRDRLRKALAGEKGDTPDGVMRTLIQWGDAGLIMETLGEDLAGHPMEIDVLQRSPDARASERLWEMYQAEAKELTARRFEKAARVGTALTMRRDKRGVDALLELLTSGKAPSPQHRNNVCNFLAAKLGRDFGYGGGNYRPELENAVEKMLEWWHKNREEFAFP